MKKTQNYSNHRHLVPLYHYLTFFALLVLIAGAIKLLFTDNNKSQLLPWLFLLLVLVTVSIALFSRFFALKAQDRAIRAEENLRYFILTGKILNQQVTLQQIIALRFASDEEFVALVDKASTGNLKPDEIKRMIKNWRPDFHRA
jgi:hypothetical protein